VGDGTGSDEASGGFAGIFEVSEVDGSPGDRPFRPKLNVSLSYSSYRYSQRRYQHPSFLTHHVIHQPTRNYAHLPQLLDELISLDRLLQESQYRLKAGLRRCSKF
jgi:hypothetical protein